MRRLCLLLVVVLIFGCKQPEKKVALVKPATHYDSVLAQRAVRKAQNRREFLADSIKQDSVLNIALKYASAHVMAPYKQVELPGLKNTEMTCILTFGHLFSKDKKHLIVQDRVNDYQFNWNVFVLDRSGFKQVVTDVINDLTFVDHFIKDVNGDGNKDFLLNWYPESGCCMRSVFNAYLYKPETGEFTTKYEFMNPTFSALEKVVRGVGYGHPGLVELYKFKWKGLKLDTVEFISPDTAGKKYYRTKTRAFGPPGELLTSIPKEYRKITGYEWFKGDYYREK